MGVSRWQLRVGSYPLAEAVDGHAALRQFHRLRSDIVRARVTRPELTRAEQGEVCSPAPRKTTGWDKDPGPLETVRGYRYRGMAA